MTRFESAKEKYARLGVDVDAALAKLSGKAISIHCWQGDDVIGFESAGRALSGGIQTTGNYPGRARTPAELMADFDLAASLIPGKKRINLHASYAIFEGDAVDRDELRPEHFAAWVKFARERGYGIDFNPTCFSHPMVKDGLTLSSPDEEVRRFWIRHGIASRRIAAAIAKELGEPVLNNVWIPDGYKHTPADRLGPRVRLAAALDEIFAEKLEGVIDCVESKVFGIGVESYTVGSNEFYMSYAASHPGIYNLLDNAVRFSDYNSEITLETTEKSDLCYVSVTDEGPGIAPGELSRIWDRFYKSDVSRGKDRKGTGLGLTIVKEIISAHGRTIDVISTPGKGSTFVFSLEMAD